MLEHEVRAYDNEDAKMAASANPATELEEKMESVCPCLGDRDIHLVADIQSRMIFMLENSLYSPTCATGCMNVVCFREYRKKLTNDL